MAKGKTKLKKLDMTSVDLVRRGANQKADIMLYKSAEDDIPQGLWKSIHEAVASWWNGEQNESHEKEFNVTKASYMDAIDYSIDSIIKDDTLDSVTKAEMAAESINQFAEALMSEVAKAVGAYEAVEDPLTGESGPEEQTLDGVEKNAPESNFSGHFLTEYLEEGESDMKIDKSRFEPEELAQYEALIAKGLVEEEENLPPKKKKAEEEIPEEEMEKSIHPEVAKALAEVEEMKKSFEMRELHEVAKKYSVLGKEEDKLVETLYSMKKSSPENYNSYIAVLDEQVSMVEKSGIFTEIGKSGHGYVPGGDVVGKIEAIASDIQKSAPEMSRAEAVMKAWDQHPELLEEYEKDYKGGK